LKFSKVICFVVLALCLGLCGCTFEPPADDGSGLREKTAGDSVAVEVNSRAPALAARTLDGGQARLGDYLGTHVVLLEFWSIFCKSCIEEMPHIMALRERYRSQGFEVLSINTDIFSDARILTALKKAGVKIDYPVLRDSRQEIAKAYNVEILPVTVIIDRSGWIRLYQEGYRPGDEERFDSLIQKLVHDDEVDDDITLAPRDGVTDFAAPGGDLITEGRLEESFTLTGLGGERITVGEDRQTVLFFWSLYCSPCRAEFPHMLELRKKYASRGVDICSVNVDSRRLEARVRKFIAKYPGLPCIPDWNEPDTIGLANLFSVGSTPTVIMLDAQGSIAFASAGSLDTAALEAALEKALQTTETTK
jgi:thiol-disulfide isomerase/thioredoxin